MVNIDIEFQKFLVDTFKDKQKLLMIEEPAELIQAITKASRNGATEYDVDHLAEEIADTYAVIEQLKYMYSIDDKQIQKWIDYKRERTKNNVDKILSKAKLNKAKKNTKRNKVKLKRTKKNKAKAKKRAKAKLNRAIELFIK